MALSKFPSSVNARPRLLYELAWSGFISIALLYDFIASWNLPNSAKIKPILLYAPTKFGFNLITVL